jgi:hypothetical protein
MAGVHQLNPSCARLSAYARLLPSTVEISKRVCVAQFLNVSTIRIGCNRLASGLRGGVKKDVKYGCWALSLQTTSPFQIHTLLQRCVEREHESEIHTRR